MVDEIDRKILSLLMDNARLSVREIGRKLGLSPAAVSKRLNKLEKNGIIKKYTVVLDEKIAEATCSLMLMIHVGRGVDPDTYAKKLSKLPEICWCIRVTGYYEILAVANCKNPSDVSKLLDKIKSINQVTEVSTSLIINKYKIRPLFLVD